VQALRDHHQMIAGAEKAKELVDNLFMDIVAWGKKNKVEEIVWGPRPDEGFFAVVAADEDESGALQDSLSRLDYQLYQKYKFRLSFVLFRASEADGVASFVAEKAGRHLFRARPPSTSGKSES
jgi:hypothetical protein